MKFLYKPAIRARNQMTKQVKITRSYPAENYIFLKFFNLLSLNPLLNVNSFLVYALKLAAFIEKAEDFTCEISAELQ